LPRWRRKYAEKQPMRPPPMTATSTDVEIMHVPIEILSRRWLTDCRE